MGSRANKYCSRLVCSTLVSAEGFKKQAKRGVLLPGPQVLPMASVVIYERSSRKSLVSNKGLSYKIWQSPPYEEILLPLRPLADQDSSLRPCGLSYNFTHSFLPFQAHGSILVTMATVTEMACFIICNGQPPAPDSKLTA